MNDNSMIALPSANGVNKTFNKASSTNLGTCLVRPPPFAKLGAGTLSICPTMDFGCAWQPRTCESNATLGCRRTGRKSKLSCVPLVLATPIKADSAASRSRVCPRNQTLNVSSSVRQAGQVGDSSLVTSPSATPLYGELLRDDLSPVTNLDLDR